MCHNVGIEGRGHPVDLGPCIPPCLRQGHLFPCRWNTSLADLWASGSVGLPSH